jgi:hypothetical protein
LWFIVLAVPLVGVLLGLLTLIPFRARRIIHGEIPFPGPARIAFVALVTASAWGLWLYCVYLEGLTGLLFFGEAFALPALIGSWRLARLGLANAQSAS